MDPCKELRVALEDSRCIVFFFVFDQLVETLLPIGITLGQCRFCGLGRSLAIILGKASALSWRSTRGRVIR